jgi:AsmA protein
MRTLIKLIIWLIGLFILLVIAAAVAIPLLFDPNDFKPEIEHRVLDRTGRELNIEGNIELTYFPWLGLRLGRVVLANPPGHAQPLFASIEQADLHARVSALLRRELQIDTVVLHGLHTNLSVDADGRGNWDDLSALAEQHPQAAGAVRQQQAAAAEQQNGDEFRFIREVSVNGLDLRDAYIDWQDAASGQHYRLSDLSLQTGAIRPGAPVDIDSRFQLQASDPALTARVLLKSRLEFDPAEQKLYLRDLDLQTTDLQSSAGDASPVANANVNLTGAVDVDIDDQTLAIEGLALTADLQGDIAGTLELKGDVGANLLFQQYRVEHLALDADLSGTDLPDGGLRLALTANSTADLIKQSLTVADLDLTLAGLKITATVNAESLLTQPRFSGPLEIAPFNPRDLLQRLGRTAPATADAAVLSRASLAAQFVASVNTLTLDPLILRLDDSTLQGRLSVPDFRGPALRYDLRLDAIDVDRYLAPPATAAAKVSTPGAATARRAAQGELPLAALRPLNIDGTLRIGRLGINRLQIDNAVLPLQAAAGVLSLSPASAELYGGRYRGNVLLDAGGDQPVISLNEALTGIQAGPLLQALAGEERLLGTANATAQLTMRGATAAAIRDSLNGIAQFQFSDGAYQGVNIAQMLRQAQATLTGQPLPADDAPLRTDFSELRFSLRFQDGMVSNDDLSAKSPLLRISGQGSADLVSEQLDYGVMATAVASAEGQGGAELGDLRGIAVPIRISGTLTEPQYGLDLEALAKLHAEKLLEEEKDKLVQQAQEKLQEKVEQELGDKIGEEVSKQVGEELGDALGEEAGKLLKGLFGN